MKRLISVLAMALILTMMSWGTVTAVGAPEKLAELNYDHPWGGDHQTDDFPLSISDPKGPVTDIQKSGGFTSWITNWFLNSIYYLNLLPKGDITTDITDDTNTDNDATNYNYTGSSK